MQIYSLKQESKFKTKKRTHILNVAYTLFVEKSIEEVNMQDIAAKCEMERRSLYNYYNNKEQIAIDIMKCWYEQIEGISHIDNVVFENTYAKIRALVYRFYDFAIEDPDAVKFSVHFEHFFRSRYSDMEFKEFSEQKKINILHDKLLKEGIEDGSIKDCYKDNLHEISLAIQGAMLSYTQRIIFREDDNNPILINTLLNILLDSIKA